MKDDKKQITLRIPDELYKALSEEAIKRGIPVMDMLNIILYQYFQNSVQE